jgi:8-oxo-dGTP pyrophosphatase MutT (NUDIX family)
MIEYVAGLLFSRDRSLVALICKERPGWQREKWNAIGGKIEPSDDCPLHAMRREFREETAVTVNDWQSFCTVSGEGWRVHYYRGFAPRAVVESVSTVTDEVVAVWPLTELPCPLMTNLRWLIEMALSMDAERAESFRITEQPKRV